MQVLDHAAIYRDDTAAVGETLLERCDHTTGVVDFVGRRSPHVVSDLNLRRMDEGLAVEAHLGALHTLGAETVEIFHVVVHAVEDDLAGLACSGQGHGEMWNQWLAARHQTGA